MQVLKFNFNGDTAFFKKPEVNTYRYLTYGQLHKVALCGILGCIIGLNGYSEQKEDEVFPEFYEKLKDIKISIVPKNTSNKAGFSKTFQSFNNSTGFASLEEGGNLIVREQWLIDVSWDIYLVVDNEITEKIKNYITNRNCIYTPYLGKNDHYLNIEDICVYDSVEWSNVNEITTINSMFLKNDISIDKEKEEEIFDPLSEYWDEKYTYKEFLPLALNKNLMYVNQNFLKVHHETPIKIINKDSLIATIDNSNLYFY